MPKQMKRFFKILVSIILCISYICCLLACTQENSNTNKPIQTTSQTLATPSWPSTQATFDESSLRDIFDQIESTHTYIITYSVNLEYNNSVGNEWDYGIIYNNEYIESSSVIIIKDNPTKIELVAFATELDDWNDCGTTTITFDALSVGEKQTGWATVIVKENNGRYEGNTAEWYFDIMIERI